MIPIEFSAQTLDLLRRSGWSPDRRIPTDSYRTRLSKAGYVVSPAVLEFLQSFGGLSITRPTSLGDDTLSFDPADAHVSRARVRTYERFLDTTLCVIGSYFTQSFAVMMDPNGKVYSGADDTLRHLGDSGEEAIENLLTKHKSTLLQGG